MNLAIDIGNTFQKIAVFNHDECICCQSVQVITTEELASIIRQYSIKNSIISSVADMDVSVVDLLKKKTNFVHYSHKTKLPVTILYKTADCLGLDRIANAVGAAMLYPAQNILSIQAGTCLVFDFVNEKSEYLGGSISPGIKMRLEALHEKTKNLPYVILPETRPNIFGTDTHTSLSSGVLNGICCEIESFIADYQAKFNNLNILLTGGDAIFLQKLIKNTIFAAPNVVLKGLNEIIKYNVR
jgi:type III pantothenate kinase